MLVDFTSYTPRQVKRYMAVLEEYEVVEIVGGYQSGRKKQYRLLEECLEEFNLSVIPSPEEIRRRVAGHH